MAYAQPSTGLLIRRSLVRAQVGEPLFPRVSAHVAPLIPDSCLEFREVQHTFSKRQVRVTDDNVSTNNGRK